ncbi:hypothetical protein, partial [Streptococcus pneumoniae]|uniref:hypothetical protein n=1 Tax=Streptococcus pneumoniae TaxID=1313 RepID=UPI001E33D16C
IYIGIKVYKYLDLDSNIDSNRKIPINEVINTRNSLVIFSLPISTFPKTKNKILNHTLCTIP